MPTLHPAIPVFDVRIEDEDVAAVERVLRSGWLSLGSQTEAFEVAFARQLGVAHGVAVSSCTAALHLACLAAGVGPGDEVIVPSFTFVATASSVVYCGARPVFADIRGLDDPSIDPDAVERVLGPRTRAIIAVHFAGYAAPVDRLAALCRDRGIHLLEDVAHAPSATLNGRKLGSFGLAAAFSFFSNKVLSVGEGGLLATDDDEIADRARRRRSNGLTRSGWEKWTQGTSQYDVDLLGFNYRIDDMRSALALSRLARLEEDILRRQELTRRYRAALAGRDDLVVPFTDEAVGCSSAYAMVVFLRDHQRRDDVRRRLLERHGVQTTVLYPSVHRFSAFAASGDLDACPLTDRAAQSSLVLPLFAHMRRDQQDLVVDALIGELEE